MFLYKTPTFENKRAMPQQNFREQVTTLHSSDDITQFDGTHTYHTSSP